MSPERTIGAVSRLSGVAVDYPELAAGITGLISGLLVRESPQEPKPVAQFSARTNGFANHSEINIHDHVYSRRTGTNRSHPTIVRQPVEVTTNGRPGEWYTASEVALMFGRSEWSVGQWCREGKIKAEKQQVTARGSKTWVVSAEEVDRLALAGFREDCHCRNS